MKKEKLDIVYEDKALIIVNKKNELLTISSEKEKIKTLYHEVLVFEKQKNKNNKIFIVNRLDKDTSGLVMFAKSERIKRIMQDNWINVKRYYYALVKGKISPKQNTIKSLLLENRIGHVYENRKGKIAITDYKLIKNIGDNSLLDIQILTGRKHQIRYQLNSIGYPIIGDTKYGYIKAKRLCLHAYKLVFEHPLSGKEIIVETKKPDFIK